MTQCADLVGTKHDRLSVVARLDNKSGKAIWLCLCECGTNISLPTNRAKSQKCCRACSFRQCHPGEKFDRLIVLRRQGRRGQQALWECQCGCGNKALRTTHQLKSGAAKNCGCIRWNSANLIDRRNGMLTILRRTEIRKNRSFIWECKCDCGKIVYRNSNQLLHGNLRSCGCRNRKSKARNYRWSGHGDISGTIWGQIKRSAQIRGISFSIDIQDAWALFLKQDGRCAITLLPIKFPSLFDHRCSASLDRIDSSKGYESSNIQWLHKEINRMKGTLSQLNFVEMCKNVAQNYSLDKCQHSVILAS